MFDVFHERRNNRLQKHLKVDSVISQGIKGKGKLFGRLGK